MRYPACLLAVLVLGFAAPAAASCFSIGGYTKCTDAAGNEYNAQVLGSPNNNMTISSFYNSQTKQTVTSNSMNISSYPTVYPGAAFSGGYGAYGGVGYPPYGLSGFSYSSSYVCGPHDCVSQ